MSKKNPYEGFEVSYEKGDLDKLEKMTNDRQFSGVYCPRRNDQKNCAVCRDVRKLWDYHNDTGLEVSKFSEKAKRFNAAAAVYMNVIFPNEPSTVKVMQCGIKMLTKLVNGMKYQKWGNVHSPTAGRTIIVHKEKDDRGFNAYTPSPDTEKGKRELDDMTVLDNLYDLDRVAEMRENGTVDVFNISSIERTVEFDILPGWDAEDRKIFFKTVYYHYNIDPDAIERGIGDAFTDVESDVEEDTPFVADNDQVENTAVKEEPKVKRYTIDNAPSCCGIEFDPNDHSSIGCGAVECEDIYDYCAEATAKFKAEESARKKAEAKNK